MESCCSIKNSPDSTAACSQRDLTTQRWSRSTWLATATAFIVGALFPIARPILWSTSLALAGVLCVINAARCGRLHCYITGPFFLAASVLSILRGTGVISLSWTALGIGIVLATAFAYAPEFVLGKYVRDGSRAAGRTRCKICKLEFADPELASTCEEWCSTHNSCNLEIARQAINKARASEERDERLLGPNFT
jgi:hypothetical protein